VYASGEDAVVTGVKPGERIVLDGRQNLRPGATVIERAANDGGRGGRQGKGASAAAAGAAGATSPAAASGNASVVRSTPA
jgi:hypothetical protein